MKTKNEETKIMIFGTFDGLHAGHLHLFKQARRLAKNPFLIASIARDKNVFKIKGESPRLGEKKRTTLVRKCKLIDKVVLSGMRDHVPHIVKERPKIIALGYDQKFYIKNLKKDLKNKGLEAKIVRLRPYKEKIFKNHLLRGKN